MLKCSLNYYHILTLMLGDFCFCFSQVLRNAVLFLILAPYDNEQSDLIHRVSEEKTLDEIHLYRYSLNNSLYILCILRIVWSYPTKCFIRSGPLHVYLSSCRSAVMLVFNNCCLIKLFQIGHLHYLYINSQSALKWDFSYSFSAVCKTTGIFLTF